jgi:ribulose-5-phosphate 4-epimerase/fuculose-1-phosphate aldolase
VSAAGDRTATANGAPGAAGDRSAAGDPRAPGAPGDPRAPGASAPPAGEHISALITAGRRVGAKQLTWGTAGNVSVRLPDGRFAISGSGHRLDELESASIVACQIASEAWEGSCRPSVETAMHRGIYAARPDAGAVLHSSAFHTTLVACSAIELETAASTDTLYYLRRIARLPFLVPGSPELARAVAEAAREHDAILLGNHGSVVVGRDLAAAVNVAEALELMCRMLVARTQGFPLLPIAEEQREGALHRMDE